MLTLILPALLLTGLGQSPDARVARSAATISPECVRGTIHTAVPLGTPTYEGFYKFQEGPSTQPLTIYAGPIGCAAQLTGGAKLKTVPTNAPKLTKPIFRVVPAQP